MRVQIIIFSAVALTVLIVVGGCTTHGAIHQRYDLTSIGMTEQEVQQNLGLPAVQSSEAWTYVAPFHLVVIPFGNRRVADKIRYEDYERDYSAREYTD